MRDSDMIEDDGFITVIPASKKVYDRRHGGPWDRGSADAYYWRRGAPHYYEGNTGTSPIVTIDKMTEEEIEAYWDGYNNEDDRKDWG